MSTYDEDDAIGSDNGEQVYEVGYGKPPKHGQFKKGNPGGPGKPKGSKNLKTIVTEALGARITAKVNGKSKKISKAEAAMHQLANKAAAGDLRAIEKSVALQERYGPQEEAPASTPAKDDPDIATLRNYLDWHDELYGEDEDDD